MTLVAGPREARLLGPVKTVTEDWCSREVGSGRYPGTQHILCSRSVSGTLAADFAFFSLKKEKSQCLTAKTPSSPEADTLATLRKPWSPQVGKEETNVFQGLLQGWYSEFS